MHTLTTIFVCMYVYIYIYNILQLQKTNCDEYSPAFKVNTIITNVQLDCVGRTLFMYIHMGIYLMAFELYVCMYVCMYVYVCMHVCMELVTS